MLHYAAYEGQAEVVQILINEYNFDPTARTKVCGQTCRWASGVLYNAFGRCSCDRYV